MLAATKNPTSPTQIALAWLLRQNENIVPIPGTTKLSHLEDNLKAVNLSLPQETWDEHTQFLDSFEFAGERYPEAVLRLVDRTPD